MCDTNHNEPEQWAPLPASIDHTADPDYEIYDALEALHAAQTAMISYLEGSNAGLRELLSRRRTCRLRRIK